MPAAPGPLNVFVPTFSPGATGALQTEFSRNPNSFRVNEYSQLIPVRKRIGKFLRLDPDNAARIESLEEYNWPDGTNRPRGDEQDHDFPPYATDRHSYGFRLGDITTEQADWDIIAAHARAKAQKAMTARTQRAFSLLAETDNWPAESSGTAASIGGGVWDAGVDAGEIQGTIQGARLQVLRNTNGAVDIQNEFMMVIGPDLAKTASQTLEIKNYVKNYPRAEDFLRGQAIFQQWGLPPELWGVKVVVDHTILISARRGETIDTTNKFPIWDSRTANAAGQVVFVSRPGGLVGTAGVPSFSTCSNYVYAPGGGADAEGRGGDLMVETLRDPWNRVTNGSVVDDHVFVLTAPAAGFVATDVFT